MDIHSQLRNLDFAVLFGYLLVLIALGAFISFRKKRNSGKDYFLAGKTLKWYNIGFTMWGTNVGPSMLIASCAIGYTTGIVAGNFAWYAFVFIFLLAVVFAPHYSRTKISTLPQFMGKRFNDRTQQLLAWYSIITIVFSWLGLNLYAGSILISQIFDWPLVLSAISLMSISAFFAVTGGLETIAVTNVFQMVFLIIASATLLVLGLHAIGDIGMLKADVPGRFWDLFQPLDNPDYPWLAIVLGYPVLGVWFWCTDQSMVQSVLGAKDLKNGQLGMGFTAWLKILDVPLFILPGIICFLLFPDLKDENEAYMTLVTELMPVGMVGAIMAILVAALVSTIGSALNSLSTVFSMDIIVKNFRPDIGQKKLVKLGKLVNVAGSVIAVFLVLLFESIKGLDLFSLFQAILGYLAPPMSAIFLLAVFWKRTTAFATNAGLVMGSLICIIVGSMQLSQFPDPDFWPHFLYVSFFLFLFIVFFIVVLSLTGKPDISSDFPSLRESYKALGYRPGNKVIGLWSILFVVMISLYIIFN